MMGSDGSIMFILVPGEFSAIWFGFIMVYSHGCQSWSRYGQTRGFAQMGGTKGGSSGAKCAEWWENSVRQVAADFHMFHGPKLQQWLVSTAPDGANMSEPLWMMVYGHGYSMFLSSYIGNITMINMLNDDKIWIYMYWRYHEYTVVNGS